MQYTRDSATTPTNDHHQLPSRQSSFASSCAGGGDDSSSILSIHKLGNTNSSRKRGAEDAWICSMCTAENTELALLCDVCGTRKCRVERRDSMSSAASYSLDELLASDCFDYDGPDDGWEQQQQHNESIATAGASSRQDSVSNESALRLCMGNWSLQDRDEWSCVTCTFVNQPLYLQCEMCGQSRPPGIPGVSTCTSSGAGKKKAAAVEEQGDDSTVRRLQAERMQEVIVTELPKEKRRATFAAAAAASTPKTATTTRRRGTSPARLLPGGRSLSPLPTPAAAGRRSRSPLPPSGRGRQTLSAAAAAIGGQRSRCSRSPLPPSTAASDRPRLNAREQSLRFMDLQQQQQQQEPSAFSVQKPRRTLGDSQATETTFGTSSSTFNTGGWGSFYNNNGFGTSSFQGSSMGAFQWNYYDDSDDDDQEEEAQRQMSLEDKVQKLQVESPGGGSTVGAEASIPPPAAAAPASSSEVTSSSGRIHGNSAEC